MKLPKYNPEQWILFIETSDDNSAHMGQIVGGRQHEDDNWYYQVKDANGIEGSVITLMENDIVAELTDSVWKTIYKPSPDKVLHAKKPNRPTRLHV